MQAEAGVIAARFNPSSPAEALLVPASSKQRLDTGQTTLISASSAKRPRVERGEVIAAVQPTLPMTEAVQVVAASTVLSHLPAVAEILPPGKKASASAANEAGVVVAAAPTQVVTEATSLIPATPIVKRRSLTQEDTAVIVAAP